MLKIHFLFRFFLLFNFNDLYLQNENDIFAALSKIFRENKLL